MGNRIKTNLDPDLEDEVLRRHNQSGRSKSQIVNDMAREGWQIERNKGDTLDSFITVFGQSLFVAGPLIALLSTMGPGIGVMMLGLGLMLWGSMQKYVRDGHSHSEALKLTLGV